MENSVINSELVVYGYDSLFSAYFPIDAIRDGMTLKAVKSNVLAFDYINTNPSILTSIFKVKEDEEVIRKAMINIIKNINKDGSRDAVIVIPEFLRLVRFTDLVIPFTRYMLDNGIRIAIGVDDMDSYELVHCLFASYKTKRLKVECVKRKTDTYCRIEGDILVQREVRKNPIWLNLDIFGTKAGAYTNKDIKTSYAMFDCVNKLNELSKDMPVKVVQEGLLDGSKLLDVVHNMMSLGLLEEDVIGMSGIIDKVQELSTNVKDYAKTSKDKSLVRSINGVDGLYVTLIEMIEKSTGEFFGNSFVSCGSNKAHEQILRFVLKSRNKVVAMTQRRKSINSAQTIGR